MIQNKEAIPCPNCNRIKFFEGLCFYCKQREFRITIESLNEEELQLMQEDILQNLDEMDKWGEVYKNFNSLVAYRDINTIEIARAAFENNIFYPPAIYKDSDAELQEKLIASLLDPDTKFPSQILSCLSQIPTEPVLDVFYELEQHPLPWRKNLYVGPARYAEQGGWTFDQEKNKIQLIYPTCYVFIEDDSANQSTKLGQLLEEKCPNCQCNLMNLMTIDGTDPRLAFLNLPGIITIPTCPNCCTLSDKTLIRYQVNGESIMELIEPYEDENYLTEEELKEIAERQYVLSPTAKPLYYPCGEEEMAHIGGHAYWIQDFQYDECPDCQQKMKLLGSVPLSTILDGLEGTEYIEICTDCQVISVLHQQT